MASTFTTDFTGTYDWPAEEAIAIVQHIRDAIADGESIDYIHQQIIKERQHWVKVFGLDEQGQADMNRFTEVFNVELGAELNLYM